MKKTNIKNMSRVRLLAIAAAATAISACGGGSGGGGGIPLLPIAPAPAPAPAPTPAPAPAPVSDKSAPCFNEADFHEGTTLEFEAVKPGASATDTPFKRKSVTEGREAFAGANPVAFNVGAETLSVPPVFDQRTVRKEFKDSVGGNVLLYGKSTTTKTKFTPQSGSSASPQERVYVSSQSYAPPITFPIDMTPGQVVSQQISFTKTETSEGVVVSTNSLPATGELTYQGREKLVTPLGTFDTCKFSLKVTVGSGALSKVTVNELWQASEGPYRGQVLKGFDPKSPALATKMTYTPK